MTALVTTAWLAVHLADPDIRIIDATFEMPDSGRDAETEYKAVHIPNAQFFWIDGIADSETTLPHMLPSAVQFGEQVGTLGISNRHRVIAYDSRGKGAARAWWMFRAMGHDDVAVLDGGLTKWQAERRPVNNVIATPQKATFKANLQNHLVWSFDQVLGNMNNGKHVPLDARPVMRFAGQAPEPRPGLRMGHIPGALNLPFLEVMQQDTSMLSPEVLMQKFRASGIDPKQDSIFTTCGSGVTACSLTLALYLLGRHDIPVYDGSWAEWGSRKDTPVAQGPGKKLKIMVE